MVSENQHFSLRIFIVFSRYCFWIPVISSVNDILSTEVNKILSKTVSLLGVRISHPMCAKCSSHHLLFSHYSVVTFCRVTLRVVVSIEGNVHAILLTHSPKNITTHLWTLVADITLGHTVRIEYLRFFYIWTKSRP